jgi:poly(hydroxyalkanoate) granule-associated protein
MSTVTNKTDRGAALRRSVEQVWLAGLGALAVTEEEGSKLFQSLVKRGTGFERQSRSKLRKAVDAAREVPGEAITRIESGIDGTMTGVLHRLGVPTQREIANLTRRVEALAEALESKPRIRSTRTAHTRKTTTTTRGSRKPRTTRTTRSTTVGPASSTAS